jgi:hypothetical protein
MGLQGKYTSVGVITEKWSIFCGQFLVENLGEGSIMTSGKVVVTKIESKEVRFKKTSITFCKREDEGASSLRGKWILFFVLSLYLGCFEVMKEL